MLRNARPAIRETTAADSLDRTAVLVVVGVFVALVIDGMDLQMLALALPDISKELHLSSVRAGALSTYSLFGMGIGGILAGWLADRIGRVRVVWWAVLTFSMLTCVIALCQSYWQIAVMRFVSGFGIGALYSIGTLLAAEYVPTKTRTTVLGTLQAGWSVGYVIAALRPKIGELAEQIAVWTYFVSRHLPVCENREEDIDGIVRQRSAVIRETRRVLRIVGQNVRQQSPCHQIRILRCIPARVLQRVREGRDESGIIRRLPG